MDKNEKISKELLDHNIEAILVGNVKNKSEPTEFKCLKCGQIFIMTPHNLINNRQSCTRCGKKKRWSYTLVKEYIENYDNNAYKLISTEDELTTKSGNFSTNLYAKIKHSKCNTISSIRLSHLLHDNHFCSKCSTSAHKTIDDIKKKIKEIYGDLFTVESSVYNGRRSKLSLKCKECGNITTDTAINFITNHRGCGYCNKSITERVILNKFPNIESQIKISDDLSTSNTLTYDFKMNNIFLECDGIQHFRSVKIFGR